MLSDFCYTPVAHLDRETAPQAGCEDCRRVWILDEDGCAEIDTEVFACPYCGSLETGPMFYCPELP